MSAATPRRSTRKGTKASTHASEGLAQSASGTNPPPKKGKKTKNRPPPPSPPRPVQDDAPVSMGEFRRLAESVTALIARVDSAPAPPRNQVAPGHDLPPVDTDASESDDSSDSPPPSPKRQRRADPAFAARRLASDLAGETVLPSVLSRRPLGDTLEPKIKAKIWAGRFVELPSLIPKYYDEDSLFNITTKKNSLAIRKHTSHFLSFNDWNRAFDVYTSVMATNPPSPDTVQLMIKHKADITYLHNTFPGSDAWHRFDIEFRKAVAAPDVPITWGDYDPALYGDSVMKAMMSSIRAQEPHHTTSTRGRDDMQRRRQPSMQPGNTTITDRESGISVPKKYCLAYHSGKPACRQTPCRWKHECPSCQRQHPLIKCRSTSATTGAQATPANAGKRS